MSFANDTTIKSAGNCADLAGSRSGPVLDSKLAIRKLKAPVQAAPRISRVLAPMCIDFNLAQS